MARKTRKHTKGKKGVHTIPELRRAFEHIEEAVDEMIQSKNSKETMVPHLRKEWMKVFHKSLDKKSADAMIAHRMESRHHVRAHKGGAALAGAPLDNVTRPGIYLDQGRIPGADGGLTKTVGGGYGSYVQYVDSGFSNPEIAQQSDPVGGQSVFPMAPPVGMGSNAFTPSMKGGKRKTRKFRGGMAALQQAFLRPIPADVPPTNPAFDLQRMINGVTSNASPDQTQRPPTYSLGSVYPSAVQFSV